MRTAHAGDDAKAARMIAALGDFDVGEVPGREPEPRRAEIRDEGGARGYINHRFVTRSGVSVERRRCFLGGQNGGALPRCRYDSFRLSEFPGATDGFFIFVFG